MSERRSAREMIDLIVDEGSFTSWDAPVSYAVASESYGLELAAAAARSGTDESILTGQGTVGGHRVAVIAGEFQFLAGSIGLATARRIAAAVRRATAERLPLLAYTASGGTRMQEGTPAFFEMIPISKAVADHRAAGLLYVVYLAHPTMGGVFASWGSLGQITLAEPGALIGFLGPKVYAALEQREFPAGVQTAENLVAKGIIDAIVDVKGLREVVENALSLIADPTKSSRFSRPGASGRVDFDPLKAIEVSRSPNRMGMCDVLRIGATDIVWLGGTGRGERAAEMLLAMARIDGQSCVVVGNDGSEWRANPMGPGALRVAQRGMKLAEELRLPFVTFINTPGAEASVQAEEGAIAGEIARCLAMMSSLRVPTISVLLGQGCGGGALSLLPGDVVIATENSWVSPLPLEGASVLVDGEPANWLEVAIAQQIFATDLLGFDLVDVVIAEDPPDSPDAAALAKSVAAEVSFRIRSLVSANRG